MSSESSTPTSPSSSSLGNDLSANVAAVENIREVGNSSMPPHSEEDAAPVVHKTKKKKKNRPIREAGPVPVPVPRLPPSSKPSNGRATTSEILKDGLLIGGIAAVGFVLVGLLRKTFTKRLSPSTRPRLPETPFQRLRNERAALLDSQGARGFGATVRPLALEPLATGPLSGLTFGVKDNLDVEGDVTGNGNPDWAATHPPAAAHTPAVRALLEGGARGTRKLVMDELAYSLQGTNRHFGTPCNPAAPERIPGGSSSGSAVAVAGGLCDFALGTDTAGSVRVPAACCGIVGLRPTHGAISCQGVCPLAPSLDTVGVFTGDLGTMSKVAKVLLPSTAPAPEPAAPTRVLVALDLFLRCETEQLQLAIPALEQSLKGLYGEAVVVGVSFCEFIVNALDNLGTFVSRRNAEGKADPLDALREACSLVQRHEIWTCLGDFYRRHGEGLDAAINARLRAASQVSEADARRALDLKATYTEAVASSLRGRTVMVIPSLPAYPPRLTASSEETDEWRMRAMELTSVAGFGGFPQLTFPIGVSDDDAVCPVSISLVGGKDSEHLLIALAQQLQPVVSARYIESQATFREQVAAAMEAEAGEVQAPARPPSAKENRGNGAGPLGSTMPSAGNSADAERKARAERLKEMGNADFKSGRFEAAIAHYTAAIGLDPLNPIYYSNRAMSHLKMLSFDAAERDCDRSLKLDPRNVKALLRRATSRAQAGKFGEARADLEFALHLEPHNVQAKADLAAVKNMIRQTEGEGGFRF